MPSSSRHSEAKPKNLAYTIKETSIMDEQQRKTMPIATFNTVSEGYDDRALRFFSASAGNLAALLGLRGDEQVLDVACGTGHATLAMAPLLPHGRITAVDFSPGMLGRARRKAGDLGIDNVDFIEGDMREMRFENRFDIAVCAFGIFFVLDMEAQLARIASAVKPGGRVAITNFQENYFSPLKELFFDRLASYGVQNLPQAWRRIAHEAGCRTLFETAGMSDIRVETKNVGYYLESADDWWSIVWNAGLRRYVAQLAPRDHERFKVEHLQEVAALGTEKGIWLDVGVLFTVGTRHSA